MSLLNGVVVYRNNKMSITLRTPPDKEFQKIREYIHEFELDDRDLQQEQFTAAFCNDQLVGFGRLRKHNDCTELCSLGVVTSYRKQGIGKALTAELIKRSSQNLYLVCIIPEFFMPFGFHIAGEYPSSIQNKINYCTQELVVPEQYVAMTL